MKKEKFSGTVKMVSCSPHGDPEGLVIEDGIFVKIPPHTLIAPESIAVGTEVHGTGERIEGSSNDTFHHAKVFFGQTVVSDATLPEPENEKLKKKHKLELSSRKDHKGKRSEIKSKVLSLGMKPKGEINRILLADGTSVHVPKEVELEDIGVGDMVKCTGEVRDFSEKRESFRFMKAEIVSLV